MKNKSAKNRTPGAGRTIAPEMEDVLLPKGDMDLPAFKARHADREPALALHMGLPGTRLDIVLGGPHPLLADIMRSFARVAAQADHAAELAREAGRHGHSNKD